MIGEILTAAKAQGACRLTDGVRTWEDLVALFFSPQGREFCELHKFPSSQLWERLTAYVTTLRNLGVYLDAGAISLQDAEYTALIGKTQGDLKFKSNNCIHRVVLQKGAHATIHLAGSALAEVIKDEESTADITITDKAILL